LGTHHTATPRELRVAVGAQGELAATWFAGAGGSPRPVLVCLPGGSYTRRYFDLDVPGHAGYSFAAHAAARGFPVLTFDMLGTGESTRPGHDIDMRDQAEAINAALGRLPDLVGQAGPFVAVGHSMGGYVAMLQQAAHGSYDALAILGTTNQHVAPLALPAEMITAAATPEGRAAIAEQIAAGIPDAYIENSRGALLSWFHLADVPRAVVDADLATTQTVVPRRCAANASVPGITVEAAGDIEVPVFLAYGDVDVSPAPHLEPSYFTRSRDVSLYVLADSGHCHNMANTRTHLWDRMLDWCDPINARRAHESRSVGRARGAAS
jgi:pimeloyl-ACP methyl ester carboxylesterase